MLAPLLDARFDASRPATPLAEALTAADAAVEPARLESLLGPDDAPDAP